jgi:hypothetical protein
MGAPPVPGVIVTEGMLIADLTFAAVCSRVLIANVRSKATLVERI